MNAYDVIDLAREALIQAFFLAAPLLAAALLTSVLMGMLQTLTQVQDSAVSMVPRILAVLAALGICLPWMLDRIVEYSQTLFQQIPLTVTGG